MESIINFFVGMNWAEWIVASQLLLASVIGVLKLIPGNQGEVQLEAVANFIGKLIKK